MTLTTFTQNREEAGEILGLVLLVPETSVLGTPEGEFGMFNRLIFFIFFLSFTVSEGNEIFSPL